MRTILLILGLTCAMLAVTIPMAVVQLNKIDRQPKPTAYVYDEADKTFMRDIMEMESHGCYTGDLRAFCIGPMNQDKLNKCHVAVQRAVQDLSTGCKGVKEDEN